MPVVFFDSECGLCDHAVAWMLRAPGAANLRFAPGKGSTFREFQSRFPSIPEGGYLVFWERDTDIFFFRSRAVAAALYRLGGWRKLAGRILLLVPSLLSDGVYHWVARNRHRFCRLHARCDLLPENRKSLILP